MVTIATAEAQITKINKLIASLLTQVVDLTETLATLRNTEKAEKPKSAEKPIAAPAAEVVVVETAAPAPAAEAPVAEAVVVETAAPAPAAEAPVAAPATEEKVKGHRRTEDEIIAQVLDGTGKIPSSLKNERLAAFMVKLEAARAARAASASAPEAPAAEAPVADGFTPPASGLFAPVVEDTPSIQPIAETVAP